MKITDLMPEGRTEERICIGCGKAFQSQEMFRGYFASWCGPCSIAEQERARERERNEENQAREKRWAEICPVIYRETDLNNPDLNPAFRAAAMDWTHGPKGLGFMGTTGGGKTRMLFRALRRCFDAGKSTRFITHNAFSKLVIDAFSNDHHESRQEARKKLEYLSRVGVLLFDDLGKAPSTERCDAELEELIEVRASNLLPTLWSANGHGEWLAERFGKDRGYALVRRLAEFSTVVKA